MARHFTTAFAADLACLGAHPPVGGESLPDAVVASPHAARRSHLAGSRLGIVLAMPSVSASGTSTRPPRRSSPTSTSTWRSQGRRYASPTYSPAGCDAFRDATPRPSTATPSSARHRRAGSRSPSRPLGVLTTLPSRRVEAHPRPARPMPRDFSPAGPSRIMPT